MRRISTILVTSVMLRSLGTPVEEEVKASTPALNKPQRASTRILKNQQEEWNTIMALYERGKQILSDLERNPRDKTLLGERQRVFLEAAQKLRSWIDKYERDANSLVFLRATYRLGNFWEYSYDFKEAERSYQICEKHPLLQSAQFDGKPLAPQLQSRLLEVERNKNYVYVSPGYVRRHSKAFGGKKGGGKKAPGTSTAARTVVGPDMSEPPEIVNDTTP